MTLPAPSWDYTKSAHEFGFDMMRPQDQKDGFRIVPGRGGQSHLVCRDSSLASHKINHDKLDDSARPVLGLYEIRPSDPEAAFLIMPSAL
jgi:hypothetical protein